MSLPVLEIGILSRMRRRKSHAKIKEKTYFSKQTNEEKYKKDNNMNKKPF